MVYINLHTWSLHNVVLVRVFTTQRIKILEKRFSDPISTDMIIQCTDQATYFLWQLQSH